MVDRGHLKLKILHINQKLGEKAQRISLLISIFLQNLQLTIHSPKLRIKLHMSYHLRYAPPLRKRSRLNNRHIFRFDLTQKSLEQPHQIFDMRPRLLGHKKTNVQFLFVSEDFLDESSFLPFVSQ